MSNRYLPFAHSSLAASSSATLVASPVPVLPSSSVILSVPSSPNTHAVSASAPDGILVLLALLADVSAAFHLLLSNQLQAIGILI